MAEQFVGEKNLNFLLYEVFKVEDLLQYPRYADHSREEFDMISDMAMKMGKNLFKPCLSEMDKIQPEYVGGKVKVHPAVKTIMKECGEGGWISALAPVELGGQQLPHTINFIPMLIFAATNYSASVYPMLTSGAAHLIESFGTKEQIDHYIPKMFAGLWQGTMALTEPQAGSSLADISTIAVPAGDGYYNIRGQKLFISAGDHDGVENVVHLALARIKDAPAGVKGISLFIVPKYRAGENGKLVFNDVNCAGIYHKLGYRGAPITQLSFGENDDCRGYLIAQPGKGLFAMFQMMNAARIEVGLGAAAIASAAYYAALEYTRERPQGRPITAKDPTTPQIPIIEHADIKRMLLFQRAVVEGSLSLLMQCSLYSDMELVTEGEEKERYNLLLEILTPVAKSYPSEMGILAVSQGLQCLGGYGYCDEFPLEQFYRDVRIHPIHEGTTGIQGMDLLGRKVTMQKGKAFNYFLEELNKTIVAATEDSELTPLARELVEAVENLKKVTSHLIGIALKGSPDLFLADATLYLEAFSIIGIAWQWLKQGLSVREAVKKGIKPNEQNFYEGKLYTMRYFFGYELPKIEGLFKRLMTADGLTVAMKSEYFQDNA
jgi:alkylation response protein AidB-like acyl-CoA dehydrogenase